jgi:hypothetical protein
MHVLKVSEDDAVMAILLYEESITARVGMLSLSLNFVIPRHISGIFVRIRFQCFFHKNHAFKSQRLHLILYLGFFKVILFLE